MAKQIIADAQELNLPICKVSKFGMDRWGKTVEREKVVVQASNVGVRHSELEKRCGTFILDVSLTLADGSSLFVEIHVTHGINQIKQTKLRYANTRCLEIRINANEQLSDPDELRLIVLEQAPREWVFHPGVQEAEETIQNWFAEEAKALEALNEKHAQLTNTESRNLPSEAKPAPQGEPMDRDEVQWLYYVFCRLREAAAEGMAGEYEQNREKLLLIADIDLITSQLYRAYDNMSYFTVVTCIDMDLTHEDQMRRLMTPGGGAAVPVTLRDLYDAYQQLYKHTYDHVYKL